jgi:hypothetical protein
LRTVITLKLANRALQRGDGDADSLVSEALDQAERATAELRELSHGILPTVLTRGGLRAAVDALHARMPVPVATDVPVGRLPTMGEAIAYFVVAEALTNIAKYAHAQRTEVTTRVEGNSLHVEICDDGVGGAQPDGSGLLGIRDRLPLLDGPASDRQPRGRRHARRVRHAPRCGPIACPSRRARERAGRYWTTAANDAAGAGPRQQRWTTVRYARLIRRALRPGMDRAIVDCS